MLQRLQTLYFLAIIIICIVLCSGAVISIHTTEGNISKDYVLNVLMFNVYENQVQTESQIQYALAAIVAIILGWTLKVIFSYKDRNKQIKAARINFLFMLLLLLAVFSTATMKIPGFRLASLTTASVFGLAFILFMFYLNWRAIMLIKRDEELVKSADRIR